MNTSKAQQGTSSGYLLRRLTRAAEKGSEPARHALEGYQNGSHKSVRAAVLEAGIVKPPTRLEQLKRLWDKATAEERAAFLAEVA